MKGILRFILIVLGILILMFALGGVTVFSSVLANAVGVPDWVKHGGCWLLLPIGAVLLLSGVMANYLHAFFFSKKTDALESSKAPQASPEGQQEIEVFHKNPLMSDEKLDEDDKETPEARSLRDNLLLLQNILPRGTHPPMPAPTVNAVIAAFDILNHNSQLQRHDTHLFYVNGIGNPVPILDTRIVNAFDRIDLASRRQREKRLRRPHR
jgi:hypothetical protein